MSNDNPFESPEAPYEPTGVPDKDERTWGMLCHLTGLSTLVGIPGFIAPLIIWLIKKEDMPFVDDQGREALNFHFTNFVLILGCLALMCVAIGALLLPLVGIFYFVFIVIAAIKANDGVLYRYPINIRVL